MTQPQPQAAPKPAGVILKAFNLGKSFRMGDAVVHVLRKVELTVNGGEFIAIEGRSGSGKSTLLHLLGALDTADTGDVEFDGERISSLGATARSRLRNTQFGFVFQFYHLLPELNVLENTLLGPMIELSWSGFHQKKVELRDRARQLLTDLGLADRLKHRPAHLSGGERQRVAIARALMNHPRILFADEPTGNLDTETGQQIMDLLERLHRQSGQTVIMVTHDRTLARKADRVLLLKDGRLAQADS